MVRFADDPDVRHRFVFLPDYDIAMAQPLYQGCDVWLNNPLRPLEACGTSRDEGGAQRRAQPVDPRRLVGRVVRRRQRLGHPDRRRGRRPRPARRPRGRARCTTCSRTQVAPLFYDRDATACRRAGSRWCGTRCTTLGPKVPATRMVRDYVRAALRARPPVAPGRSNGGYDGARELAAWKARVRAAWPRSGSTTWSRRASASPQLGTRSSVRAFVVARRAWPRGRRASRSCTAASTTRRDHRPVRVSLRMRRATRAAATDTWGNSSSSAPAPSGTPSG